MHLNRSYILIFYLSVGLIQHKAFVSSIEADNIKCGGIQKSNFKVSLIVGGLKVKYMQYPWMAAMMIRKKKKWSQYCGGSLINSKYVLTGAHCLYRTDGKRIKDIKILKVILGMNKLKKHEQYRQDQCIKKAIVHEQYDYESKMNDIALLELCKPINYQNTKIRPICLPDKKDKNKLYKGLAIAAGWGSRNNVTAIELPTNELVAVVLPLANYSICAKELAKLSANKYIYNTTICTYSRGCGKDACDGDSGGPLMTIHKKTGQTYLRGIISFGCPNCDGFGVYTKVSYFLDWINKKIKNPKKKKKKKNEKKKRSKDQPVVTSNTIIHKKKISTRFKKFMTELTQLIAKYFDVDI